MVGTRSSDAQIAFDFGGRPPHILIVDARFYGDIADELTRGAAAALEKAGATFEKVSVPGVLEVPAAVAVGIHSGRFEGYVALGCVIRGETSHYDIVAGESARAIMDLAIKTPAAIGNGILTVDNAEQAWVRARVGEGDKGRAAAEAALTIVTIRRRLGQRR